MFFIIFVIVLFAVELSLLLCARLKPKASVDDNASLNVVVCFACFTDQA